MNPAGRPVRFDPEPRKLVAVTIPAVMFVTAISGDPVNPPAVPEVLPVTLPVMLPEKLVAVTTPVATTPDELMVTAVPTIAVDIVAIPDADTFSAVKPDSASNTPEIVVIPEMTAPPTIVGTLPSVLAFRLFTLKSDIRDPKFEGHQ